MHSYGVTVLKPGFAERSGARHQRADGTVTLVSGAKKILVDTGGPWNRDTLPGLLAGQGLGVEDLDVVVCTHGHSDHVGNLNLFPGATLIVSYDICEGGLYRYHEFAQGRPYRLDDSVQVLATPGHTAEDVSVLVTTAEGVYGITGDLFECAADTDNEDLWLSCSSDPARQRDNRRKILELCDVIVPGHGDAFTTAGAGA